MLGYEIQSSCESAYAEEDFLTSRIVVVLSKNFARGSHFMRPHAMNMTMEVHNTFNVSFGL